MPALTRRFDLALDHSPLVNRAVFAVAATYRRLALRKPRIVTVVGSYGKTTTSRMIARTIGAPETTPLKVGCNVGLGLSFAIFSIPRDTETAVLEVALPGVGQIEMRELASILQPSAVVMTSIGTEHHDRTIEEKREAKGQMVEWMDSSGLAVMNGDDPNVELVAGRAAAKVLRFGLGPHNDYRAEDVRLVWPTGTEFRLVTPTAQREVKIRLIGPKLVYPALAAIALAEARGIGLDDAIAKLATVPPTPLRLQPEELPNGAWLLRDEFKSSWETCHYALDVLSTLPAERKIVIWGDLAEPPGKMGPSCREIATRIAGIADRVIFVTENFQRYAAGARRAGMSKDRIFDAKRSWRTAIEGLPPHLGPGDVVLIKGVGNQKLERISLALSGQEVRCELSFCQRFARCHRCPDLTTEQAGREVLVHRQPVERRQRQRN